MHARYLLNKSYQNTVQTIKQNSNSDSKYCACKLFIKLKAIKTRQASKNTVHANYLLNKTRRAIKIRCMQVIY